MDNNEIDDVPAEEPVYLPQSLKNEIHNLVNLEHESFFDRVNDAIYKNRLE